MEATRLFRHYMLLDYFTCSVSKKSREFKAPLLKEQLLQVLSLSESVGGDYGGFCRAQLAMSSGSSGGGILNSENELHGVLKTGWKVDGLVWVTGPLIDSNVLKGIYGIIVAHLRRH